MNRYSPVMLLSSALVLSSATSVLGDTPKSGVMLPTDQVAWTDNPRVPGLGLAKILGDAKTPGPFVHRVIGPTPCSPAPGISVGVINTTLRS
jgi:hypothetical protein